MNIKVRGYITSKKSESYEDCADRYAFNFENKKFAISDGVSKSFFPKIWAEILVETFVGMPRKNFDEKKFRKKCQELWFQDVTMFANRPNAKWFTKNAYNRKEPGLATFVFLSFFESAGELKWTASALGDSFLFFVPKTFSNFNSPNVIKLSSKKDFVFDNFPDYVSSIGDKDKGELRFDKGKLGEGIFILATDAIAEWIIKNEESAIEEIKLWTNQGDFEQFVATNRENENLGNDDSAILILDVNNDGKNKLSFTGKRSDISDINDLIRKENSHKEKTSEDIELIVLTPDQNDEPEATDSEENDTGSENKRKGRKRRTCSPFKKVLNTAKGKAPDSMNRGLKSEENNSTNEKSEAEDSKIEINEPNNSDKNDGGKNTSNTASPPQTNPQNHQNSQTNKPNKSGITDKF